MHFAFPLFAQSFQEIGESAFFLQLLHSFCNYITEKLPVRRNKKDESVRCISHIHKRLQKSHKLRPRRTIITKFELLLEGRNSLVLENLLMEIITLIRTKGEKSQMIITSFKNKQQLLAKRETP